MVKNDVIATLKTILSSDKIGLRGIISETTSFGRMTFEQKSILLGEIARFYNVTITHEKFGSLGTVADLAGEIVRLNTER
ncbi:MAG: hypothetical protein NTZ80_04405 [Patescibacteria group bacterium]|nr:hypothetical protein [Patescibacteria group bacterium]